MLSKIRDCFRLSGQLWIKNQPNRSWVRVLELECAVLNRLVGLPIDLYTSGRLSICLPVPAILSDEPAQCSRTFESHSAASDVLRELIETIGSGRSCQPKGHHVLHIAQENLWIPGPENLLTTLGRSLTLGRWLLPLLLALFLLLR